MPPIDKDEPVYMIGVAAKLCAVHPQTLRLYERLGLIRPQRVGTKNRMYSQTDIERLQRIQRLTQELGVNLAGVEIILDLLDKLNRMHEEMEREIDRVKQEMMDEIDRLTHDQEDRDF